MTRGYNDKPIRVMLGTNGEFCKMGCIDSEGDLSRISSLFIRVRLNNYNNNNEYRHLVGANYGIYGDLIVES